MSFNKVVDYKFIYRWLLCFTNLLARRDLDNFSFSNEIIDLFANVKYAFFE